MAARGRDDPLVWARCSTKREGILFARLRRWSPRSPRQRASDARAGRDWPSRASSPLALVASVADLVHRAWHSRRRALRWCRRQRSMTSDRGWATVKLVVDDAVRARCLAAGPSSSVWPRSFSALFARAWVVIDLRRRLPRGRRSRGGRGRSGSSVRSRSRWQTTTNPIIRMTGTSILVLIALTPLLLEQGVVGASRSGMPLARGSRARCARLAIASAPGRSCSLRRSRMPVSMLVGYSGQTLPGGPPPFP